MWQALIELLRSRAARYRAEIIRLERPEEVTEGPWAKANAIGTIFGAILAGVAAIAVWSQLEKMEQANKDSRDAFITGNRAWISPKAAAFGKDETGHYILRVNYENIGKTPALDQDIFVSLQNASPAVMNNDSAKKWIEEHNPCQRVRPVRHMAVTYPGTPDTMTVDVSGIAEARATADTFDKGGWVMLVNICFAYNTFDQPHFTRACYYHWPGKTTETNLAKCQAGQDTN